jgi:hypothetical protein
MKTMHDFFGMGSAGCQPAPSGSLPDGSATRHIACAAVDDEADLFLSDFHVFLIRF